MRIVVTGATGNKGTSLVQALAGDSRVHSIVGIARRTPAWRSPKTEWVRADVASDPLVPLFRGADAVVHLAWLIQPSRDEAELRRVNVEGSRRVFAAAAEAAVPALVHASSVGAYSPAPKDRRTAEDWPTQGIPTSFYARHKAECERLLDALERDHPEMRVVRMRPGIVTKREAATEQRRYFVGPFLPSPLVRREFVPIFPDVPGLRFQVVHADDAARAYALAATSPDARGAYNVATEPVVDPRLFARLLGARLVPMAPAPLRALVSASWRLRLQPTPPGWLDLGLSVPIMDTGRLRNELGWEPRHTASEVLGELLEGMRESAGLSTPPLDPRTSGRLRVREVLTGLGGRNP